MRTNTTGRGSGWLWRGVGFCLMAASGLATITMIVWTCSAVGKASRVGWPRIQVVKINKYDQSQPLTGHPRKHNELLGGHGSDTIQAGNVGDVIWGDYKPCCQPETQVDRLNGGPGNDHIYASHGINIIHTGGGRDFVHAHFGRGGHIYCESRRVHIYISHRSRARYRLHGCLKSHLDYRTERQRGH